MVDFYGNLGLKFSQTLECHGCLDRTPYASWEAQGSRSAEQLRGLLMLSCQWVGGGKMSGKNHKISEKQKHAELHNVCLFLLNVKLSLINSLCVFGIRGIFFLPVSSAIR